MPKASCRGCRERWIAAIWRIGRIGWALERNLTCARSPIAVQNRMFRVATWPGEEYEIAEAVVFLTSDKSSYIIGELFVDSGMIQVCGGLVTGMPVSVVIFLATLLVTGTARYVRLR